MKGNIILGGARKKEKHTHTHTHTDTHTHTHTNTHTYIQYIYIYIPVSRQTFLTFWPPGRVRRRISGTGQGRFVGRVAESAAGRRSRPRRWQGPSRTGGVTKWIPIWWFSFGGVFILVFPPRKNPEKKNTQNKSAPFSFCFGFKLTVEHSI